MQKYQDLYSEALPSISNYIAIKTNPRKYHDVHFNVVEGDLLELSVIKLTDNIKYASPTLLKIYERYYGYGYYEDGYGVSDEAEKHALIYFLLDDLLISSNYTKIFRSQERRRLKQIKYYYGLASISLNFYGMDQTELILQMENFSGSKKRIFYPSLNKELITLNRKKMVKSLKKHLLKSGENSKEIYTEIINELDNSFFK